MDDGRTMKKDLQTQIQSLLEGFVGWLQDYGESSYDHQSFFAGPLGGRAKALYYKKPLLGTLAVAPMIFCEAFAPAGRRLFWRPLRFPIADAHYAMGFAFLAQALDKQEYYHKALHFLEVLQQTRAPGYRHFCWGYPFDWVTRGGVIPKDTPLITTTPYVYEAFSQLYRIDAEGKWLEIMRSIAEHAVNDIRDFEVSPTASSCAYYPQDDKGGVINASAYRAFLLTAAARRFSEDRYWQIAERNLNFVLQAQQANGAWYYAVDGVRDFVDHFHTCFVLKALAKIERLTGDEGCRQAIEKGVRYYTQELFDEKKLPKPFSRAPRLTVYRRELYDYAECVNLAVLLQGRFPRLDEILLVVLRDLLSRWRKADGSFRSRELLRGWDNVPMHRWAQAQMFRSLSFWLYHQKAPSGESE